MSKKMQHKCHKAILYNSISDTVPVSLYSEPLFLLVLLLTYPECSSNSLTLYPFFICFSLFFLSPVFVSILVLFSCLYPLALKSLACPVAEVSPPVGFEWKVLTTAVFSSEPRSNTFLLKQNVHSKCFDFVQPPKLKTGNTQAILPDLALTCAWPAWISVALLRLPESDLQNNSRNLILFKK